MRRARPVRRSVVPRSARCPCIRNLQQCHVPLPSGRGHPLGEAHGLPLDGTARAIGSPQGAGRSNPGTMAPCSLSNSRTLFGRVSRGAVFPQAAKAAVSVATSNRATLTEPGGQGARGRIAGRSEPDGRVTARKGDRGGLWPPGSFTRWLKKRAPGIGQAANASGPVPAGTRKEALAVDALRACLAAGTERSGRKPDGVLCRHADRLRPGQPPLHDAPHPAHAAQGPLR